MIVSKVVYEKFTATEIKQREISILKAIDFNPDLPTAYEFLELLFTGFHCANREVFGILERIKDLSTYFAAMCCYDRNMFEFE